MYVNIQQVQDLSAHNALQVQEKLLLRSYFDLDLILLSQNTYKYLTNWWLGSGLEVYWEENPKKLFTLWGKNKIAISILTRTTFKLQRKILKNITIVIFVNLLDYVRVHQLILLLEYAFI